jgi:hypothetical protein
LYKEKPVLVRATFTIVRLPTIYGRGRTGGMADVLPRRLGAATRSQGWLAGKLALLAVQDAAHAH